MKLTNATAMQKQASPSFGSGAKLAKNILNQNSGIGKIAKNLEFQGLNMSFPVLIAAMLGGVLVPRLIQAQDKYDRAEILRRDLISEGTIVFGAGALSKLFANRNEKKTGFVLTKKPDDFNTKSIIKKIGDFIMPTSKYSTLKSDQIISRYSDVRNTKDGMEGFCNFIDKTGGNLKNLFSFKEESKNIMENIMGKEAFNQADNKSIINVIKETMQNAPEKLEDLYKQFDGKNNDFVKKAKAMNSAFGFFSMVVVVPLFLGFGVPALNASITKKRFKEEHANLKPAAANNAKAKEVFNTPGFMAVEKTSTAQKTNKIFSKINN